MSAWILHQFFEERDARLHESPLLVPSRVWAWCTLHEPQRRDLKYLPVELGGACGSSS